MLWEWSYKRGGMLWEWSYKRGGLLWEWSYKRGGLWWEWSYKRGGLWWEWSYRRGTTVLLVVCVIHAHISMVFLLQIKMNAKLTMEIVLHEIAYGFGGPSEKNVCPH
jgi:hypothetical protein